MIKLKNEPGVRTSDLVPKFGNYYLKISPLLFTNIIIYIFFM